MRKKSNLGIIMLDIINVIPCCTEYRTGWKGKSFNYMITFLMILKARFMKRGS